MCVCVCVCVSGTDRRRSLIVPVSLKVKNNSWNKHAQFDLELMPAEFNRITTKAYVSFSYMD